MGLESNPDSVKVYQAESLQASGTATAPGAGAAIATITTPPIGKYEVEAAGIYTVTAPAAAEDLNMGIYKGTTLLKKLPMARANNVVGAAKVIADLDGATSLFVKAVGAGTVAVVYVATISATRIG